MCVVWSMGLEGATGLSCGGEWLKNETRNHSLTCCCSSNDKGRGKAARSREIGEVTTSAKITVFPVESSTSCYPLRRPSPPKCNNAPLWTSHSIGTIPASSQPPVRGTLKTGEIREARPLMRLRLWLSAAARPSLILY